MSEERRRAGLQTIAAAQKQNIMLSWTIFNNPRDFPGKFVVRWFATIHGNAEPLAAALPHAVVESLREARACLPPGLVNIHRQEEDHPCVVETWI